LQKGRWSGEDKESASNTLSKDTPHLMLQALTVLVLPVKQSKASFAFSNKTSASLDRKRKNKKPEDNHLLGAVTTPVGELWKDLVIRLLLLFNFKGENKKDRGVASASSTTLLSLAGKAVEKLHRFLPRLFLRS